MKKTLLVLLAGVAAAFAGLVLLLYGAARALRPAVAAPPPARGAAEIAAAERARDTRLDPANPPVIHRAVDYAAGAAAPWWPRAEAPVLAELVREKGLPPVAERVGPEPVVLEGVDGPGRYGGTWYRLANSIYDVRTISWRMSCAAFVRWSPQGYPIVPHTIKSWEAAPDFKSFVFTLRRGLRWSDGAPVTADDLVYWYRHEIVEFGYTPLLLRSGSALGQLEKLDDFRVRFTFPEPNPLFLERAASMGQLYDDFTEYWTPAHYLRPFHPRLGDPEKIRALMERWRLSTPIAAYVRLKEWTNPDHPRLWPWIYRSPTPHSPHTFVRNPYYFAVDSRGQQLPYLDRLVMDVKTPDLIAVAAANGDASMQDRHVRYDDHVLLTSRAEANGYQVHHWFPATRSLFTVFPNLNRRTDPARPETAKKHALLNDARFRQALSLAIDRRAIIDAEFNGRGEPAQIDPGPDSRYHSPELFKAFTAHDPGRANQLLDAIGLTRRDREGFRTFADGARMTFFLHMNDIVVPGPAHFVIDDWAKVGVRAILRLQARALWDAEKRTYEHDFTVWNGESEFFPLGDPRNFVPTQGDAFYAPAYGLWYINGGMHGHPLARRPNAQEPPRDHPLRRAMELLDELVKLPTEAERIARFQAIQRIAAENVWHISIATPPPQLVVVKNGFRNVPRNAVFGAGFITPGNTGIETYFWEDPRDPPGVQAQTKQALAGGNASRAARAESGAPARAGAAPSTALPHLLRVLGGSLLAIALLLLALRHPFIGRRLLWMIPTMAIVALAVFTLVQLPPGDYVEAYITRLELEGTPSSEQQAANLRKAFHLDEPMPQRAARWLGLYWFATFQPGDTGLLQGNLGLSMEHQKPVNDVVGDRIVLTVAISFLTIALTWLLAVPIGIYSAVRQYSIGDYVVTFLGFLGMSVPGFLLALVVIFLANQWFGLRISGLFSPEFATAPDWTWAKFVDLCQHVWVPVLVLGLGGTAGTIRVMRANLLDELRKPYVTTARAKGLHPWRILLKYPVRLALNPVVSSIGSVFPQLVSGGAIVAMVLSLPMVGPVLLEAMLVEDVYLAGSMLVVLSLLGALGTLLSDLLLLWLDPRIRFEGGTR